MSDKDITIYDVIKHVPYEVIEKIVTEEIDKEVLNDLRQHMEEKK